ncbi:DUF3089 domain-containing protein [Sphingopyxis sp. MWB1]|uniref:DUF3089 domain-containing protein n=1 Tax=Sphingopyxis sp. MWB1 TaxID=1537715 RepID=UPI00051A60DE|nr:DUF3089 domain-containing protein [Sphingopyxis sp. MWB1]
MARKFLYLIAAIILLILAAGIVYQLFPGWIARVAFVPSAEYEQQVAPAPNAYDDPAMWFARPGMEENPAHWRPEASKEEADRKAAPDSAEAQSGDQMLPTASEVNIEGQVAPAQGNAAVFFVHPTSYYSKSSWNAPLSDRDSDHRANLFVRGMASAFDDAGEVWAPRYRQATLGAFLATDRVTAGKAIDSAYRDVEQAFDAFLAAQPRNKPIILAGHSQGALHLTTLLRTRIAGTPLAKRIAAAYIIGWPISVETDLDALGLPACETPEQKGCILSWASFAEPANPTMVDEAYDGTVGFDGRPRAGTPMLCSNPLTGTRDVTAPAEANIGTLVPTEGFKGGYLAAGKIGAACDAERGYLMIGDGNVAKNFVVAGYVLPGNNFHVYDITLFWANVRADALRRLATFEGKPSPVPPPVAAPVETPTS